MSRSSVLIALAVMLLASLAAFPSEAQEVSTDATCFGFVQSELAGRDRQPRPNLREASSEYMAPLMEEWMEQQLANGKTRFISNQMGSSGSVLCAW